MSGIYYRISPQAQSRPFHDPKKVSLYRKNPVAMHFVDDLPYSHIESKTACYETNNTPEVQDQGIAGELCDNKK